LNYCLSKGEFYMTINNIKENKIAPFEIDDIKLTRLFSFFLHSAPTIDSNLASRIDDDRLLSNWNNFVSRFTNGRISLYSDSYSSEKLIQQFERHGLSDESAVSRRLKAIVCKRKNKTETDYQCVLRHLRNSIAHGNLYLSNAGNRKYILFEDYNKRGNITARILLSQADLSLLKQEIVK
ncbi:hypothetical protein DXC23_10980, partial [Eubacterium sp. OM08-24]|uniref:hypothetical protein n=1 Tax=Eubacterium sp. OM08-24 TaxID=2292352 RepID=UPI000E8C537E